MISSACTAAQWMRFAARTQCILVSLVSVAANLARENCTRRRLANMKIENDVKDELREQILVLQESHTEISVTKKHEDLLSTLDVVAAQLTKITTINESLTEKIVDLEANRLSEQSPDRLTDLVKTNELVADKVDVLESAQINVAENLDAVIVTNLEVSDKVTDLEACIVRRNKYCYI